MGDRHLVKIMLYDKNMFNNIISTCLMISLYYVTKLSLYSFKMWHYFKLKPNIVTKFDFKYFSEKGRVERELCNPCFSENLQVQATHFCKTCDEPELLCELCAKHHTKQKLFKDHELSKVIGDFQKR